MISNLGLQTFKKLSMKITVENKSHTITIERINNSFRIISDNGYEQSNCDISIDDHNAKLLAQFINNQLGENYD